MWQNGHVQRCCDWSSSSLPKPYTADDAIRSAGTLILRGSEVYKQTPVVVASCLRALCPRSIARFFLGYELQNPEGC